MSDRTKPTFRHYLHAFGLRYQGPLSMLGCVGYGLIMPYESNSFLDGLTQYVTLVVSLSSL